MQIILLVAHGSRRMVSNDEVVQLAKKMHTKKPSHIAHILPAFLELCEPSITQGIDNCVALGATKIITLPYFLSAGRHVVTDVPNELKIAQLKHPTIEIVMTDYLGNRPEIIDILFKEALD